MESGKLSIDIGNVYDSMHNNSGLPYYAAYCELIDNSIDNEATIIEFKATKTGIIIKDNGKGIASTTQHMMNVLRMYNSTSKNMHDKIGQYGIGLKEASMRLGKSVKIKSLMEGFQPIEISVFWKTITDYTEGASYRTLNYEAKPGTEIEIEYDSDLVIPVPNATSFRYYNKIIDSGRLKIIQVNGEEYTPNNTIDYKIGPDKCENFSIEGKMIDVEIGILNNDSKVRPGFYVYSDETGRYYKYGETRLCDNVKGMEARDGLYVSIGLKGTKTDWPVDRNKRDIMNIDKIATNSQFFNLIERWKAKLYNESTNDLLSKIEQKIASKFNLNAVTVIGQEKRNKKEDGQKGTVKPTGEHGPRKEATIVAPHPFKDVYQRSKRVKQQFKVVYTDFNPRKKLTVEENSRLLTIKINKTNPLIKETLKNTNSYKEKILEELIYMAMVTHRVVPNEINYDLVDRVFYDHENLHI